jgi:ketosteroid isomerase-like protein
VRPEDELAIRDLQARYAWAVATGDVEAFAGLFTDDAAIEEGERGLRYEGRRVRAFLDDWMRQPSSPGRQHWTGQTVLEGDGERCTARSFVFAVGTSPAGALSSLIVFLGHYHDELVKVDDRWLFRRRVVQPWR